MLEKIKDCISKVSDIDISKISGEDRIDSLGLDSFEIVCLVSEISDCLNLNLEIGDMSEIETINDLIKFLEKKSS